MFDLDYSDDDGFLGTKKKKIYGATLTVDLMMYNCIFKIFFQVPWAMFLSIYEIISFCLF